MDEEIAALEGSLSDSYPYLIWMMSNEISYNILGKDYTTYGQELVFLFNRHSADFVACLFIQNIVLKCTAMLFIYR